MDPVLDAPVNQEHERQIRLDEVSDDEHMHFPHIDVKFSKLSPTQRRRYYELVIPESQYARMSTEERQRYHEKVRSI